MSKLFPVFLKWTIWGFSLETYNHQDICIHRCLTCWFSPLHVPGCERTWVLWFFWFIWVFKYFLGNVRTSKFYNLCFYLKKKKKGYIDKGKKSTSFCSVIQEQTILFFSNPAGISGLFAELEWTTDLYSTSSYQKCIYL